MRPVWPLRAALCAVLLAGCSTTSLEPDAAPLVAAPQGPATGSPAPVNATPPPVGPWLHFVSSNRLNATPLANVTVLATLAGAPPATLTWNTTLRGQGNVTWVRLDLWLDLQSSAVQTGVGGDVGCTASLLLQLRINGTLSNHNAGCASLGQGTIPPGEHLLRFGAPLTGMPNGAPLAPGDGVLVQVAFGLSFPQGQALVLAGGERVSAVQLEGLAEPLD